jgi:hypothetical protein
MSFLGFFIKISTLFSIEMPRLAKNKKLTANMAMA